MQDFKIKTIFKRMLIGSISLLLLVGVFNYCIDPFFHYHKPLNGLAYPLEQQRYQNNGMLRHFEYDALIGGSSMTENFKPSSLDSLFGTNSLKVSTSGTAASFKEMNNQIEMAFKYGRNLKMVVRSIDIGGIIANKDKMTYTYDEYPNYLYDDNYFNDVNYLFNKSVALNSFMVLLNTALGNKMTSRDDYSYTANERIYSKEEVNYTRKEKTNIKNNLSEDDIIMLNDNIMQNFVEIAIKHPKTEFYYFFTPYSICYFDEMNNAGNLEKTLNSLEKASEILTEYNNIHLYSFLEMEKYITNIDNYRDIYHYNDDMNDYILESMKEGKHLITKDNKDKYFNEIKSYFLSFDYDGYFLTY